MARKAKIEGAPPRADGVIVPVPGDSPPGRAAMGSGAFMQSGGEMGERMRNLDWAGTPPGAEEALRKKESELSEAQRLAHIGNWHMDLQTGVEILSDELQRIFGFDPATEAMPQFSGQRGRCYPVEEWERIDSAGRKALQTGVGWELDVRAIRNGAEIWITSRGEVVRDADGQIRGLRGTVQDITRLKQAEEALRESEERLRLLGDNLPDSAVYQYLHEEDGTPRFIYFSAGIERLNGVRMEEVLQDARALHQQILPEYLRRLGLEEERSKRELSDFDMEIPMRRPGGEVRWMRLRSRPRRLPDGRTIWDGVQTDMTERKAAEEGLRRREREFAAMFEQSIVGMSQADPRTLRILRVNRAFADMLGYLPEEMCRMTFIDITHPEDRQRDLAGYAPVRKGEVNRWEIEKRYLRKNGAPLWAHVSGGLIRDDEGRPAYTIAVIQDVTARKEAERVLARDKQELQRLVDERTAKLHEMVGELEHFSYTITHDLKAPLRSMSGFAEMMNMTCGGCEQTQARELLGRISTSAERMNALIRDALNYSQSVRQELPLEDVDAGALLRGMLGTYPELQSEKARIRVEGRLPVVLANEAGLTQCFSNLLGNAVKFVKPGEMPDIRVWGSRTDGWVRIWVEDKGIGISQEMLPRVFDLFSRGSKKYEGTGIGLALVRKAAQRMGGKVGAESEEGKGSRFWIELKCGEASASGSLAAASAVGEGAEGTVLYVEDEESDAMFMVYAFKGKGLAGKLQLVGDGRAAIDYLSGAGNYGDREKHPVPSLVLLDLNLPQVPGFDVLKWMRNHPDYARMPVVVFSSSTLEDDRVKALELGANEFVGKPSSGLKFGEVVGGLRERWLRTAGVK